MSTAVTPSPFSSPKIGVRLFFAKPVEPPPFIPVFQRWIRENIMPDEGLIDVVRYRHVKDGPWVMLVGTHAHFAIDNTDGRPSFRYTRRRRLDGTIGMRLRALFTRLFAAARLLEAEGYAFRLDELELSIDDRLFAPNTPETAERAIRDLAPSARLIFGDDTAVAHIPSPKGPLRLSLRPSAPDALITWSDRLAALDAIFTVQLNS